MRELEIDLRERNGDQGTNGRSKKIKSRSMIISGNEADSDFSMFSCQSIMNSLYSMLFSSAKLPLLFWMVLRGAAIDTQGRPKIKSRSMNTRPNFPSSDNQITNVM